MSHTFALVKWSIQEDIALFLDILVEKSHLQEPGLRLNGLELRHQTLADSVPRVSSKDTVVIATKKKINTLTTLYVAKYTPVQSDVHR